MQNCNRNRQISAFTLAPSVRDTLRRLSEESGLSQSRLVERLIVTFSEQQGRAEVVMRTD